MQARAIAIVCAAASVGLTLYYGHRNPSWLLIAMFVVWVLAPFATLLLAAGTRVRDTARVLMIALSPPSVAIYAYAALWARRGTPFFLLVPTFSLAVIAIALGAAALRPHRT